MRTRYIATFADTIRTDPVTLAREYLSARDATEHEFQTDEARSAYVDVLSALGCFQHRTAFARALAQFDVRPEAVDTTRQDNHLRPIAWSFGEGATFPGFTDDTNWNGFLNVRVPVSAWPYVLAELIDGADGDAETIEGYRRLGSTEGLVCLPRVHHPRGDPDVAVVLSRLCDRHDGADTAGMVRDELAARNGTELRTLRRSDGRGRTDLDRLRTGGDARIPGEREVHF